METKEPGIGEAKGLIQHIVRNMLKGIISKEEVWENADSKFRQVIKAFYEDLWRRLPLSQEEIDKRETYMRKGYKWKRSASGRRFPLMYLKRRMWTGFLYHTLTEPKQWTFGKRTVSAYSRGEYISASKGATFNAKKYKKTYLTFNWDLDLSKFYEEYPAEVQFGLSESDHIFSVLPEDQLEEIGVFVAESILNHIETLFNEEAK